MDTREQIRTAYVLYLLENGTPPPSPFVLARQLGLAETEFYDHYNSLPAVEADVWLHLFEQARTQTTAQDVYQRYSVREKLLSFYYIWIEVLKAQRSFVLAAAARRPADPAATGPFRRAFIEYAHELVAEGRNTGEVVNRPLLTERYADGFWQQAQFVLRFWVRDDSPGFELTDAAIEKAVNASFDLIGKSPLDSLLDLGKFLYQTRTARR